MKNRARRSRAKLRAVGSQPCRDCAADHRFDVSSPEQIMDLPTADSLTFSVKVYTAAFLIGMGEYSGSAESLEAAGLIEICCDEVARGHRIEVR